MLIHRHCCQSCKTIWDYDDTEIITVEPNKVFDVVINVFNEEYDKDDFIADVEYWAGEYNQGGEL